MMGKKRLTDAKKRQLEAARGRIGVGKAKRQREDDQGTKEDPTHEEEAAEKVEGDQLRLNVQNLKKKDQRKRAKGKRNAVKSTPSLLSFGFVSQTRDDGKMKDPNGSKEEEEQKKQEGASGGAQRAFEDESGRWSDDSEADDGASGEGNTSEADEEASGEGNTSEAGDGASGEGNKSEECSEGGVAARLETRRRQCAPRPGENNYNRLAGVLPRGPAGRKSLATLTQEEFQRQAEKSAALKALRLKRSADLAEERRLLEIAQAELASLTGAAGNLTDNVKKVYAGEVVTDLNVGHLVRRIQTIGAYAKLWLGRRTDSRWQCAKEVGAQHSVSPKTVRRWVKSWIANGGKIERMLSGRTRAHTSHSDDPDIQAKARRWVRIHRVRKGFPNMTVQHFCDYLNQDLLADFVTQQHLFSLTYARRFLHKLGFEVKTARKEVYFDGHERADVREYREKVFLPEMAEHQKYMAKYTGDDCMTVVPPTLQPGEKERVLVVQDECVFHANDSQDSAWTDSHGGAPKPKGEGAGFHASGFISEEQGPLSMTAEQYAGYCAKEPNTSMPQEALKTMKIGKMHKGELYGVPHEGYWTSALLLEQLKVAITIFEETHPDKVGVWMFDNSTGHARFNEDALRATTTCMNFNVGGKQNKMRDTKWEGRDQTMVFKEDEELRVEVTYNKEKYPAGTKVAAGHPLCGQPKGAKVVLEERGLLNYKEGDVVVKDIKVGDVEYKKGITVTAGHALIGRAKVLRHCCKSKKLTPDEQADNDELVALGRESEVVEVFQHDGKSSSSFKLQPNL